MIQSGGSRGAGSPVGGERPKTRPKQAMIRADQQSSLDDLARELQDARRVREERITANTLIRIAIDGLLAHGEHLNGDTEAELLASWLGFLNDRKTGQQR